MASQLYAGSATGPLGVETPITQRLRIMSSILEEVSEGTVFVSHDGKVLWHNSAFDRMLVDNSEGHLLVAAVIDTGRSLLNRRSESTESAEQLLDTQDISIGGISHSIHCILIPQGMLGPEQLVLCVIKRSTPSWSCYEQLLRKNWKLTDREAQVAVECLQGKKNLEIASCLSISVETVNKHLDKVYQKVGVRGRAQLASLLLNTHLN